MQIRGLYVRGRIDKLSGGQYRAMAVYEKAISKQFDSYKSAERFLLDLADEHPDVYNRKCKRCGKIFRPTSGRDIIYCSNACRYHNRRHKRTVMPIDFILKDMCSDKWPR